MSTLAGAFGNLHNYLHFIALPNCVDLFHKEQAEAEARDARGHVADVTGRERSRLLFNAVVSLDAVLDHAFYAEGGGGRTEQRDFNRRMFTVEPALGKLREASNALKHCVTFNPQRMNGNEVVETHINVSVHVDEEESVGVAISIDAEIERQALEAVTASFRYWVTQAQAMNALEPRLDFNLRALVAQD